MIENPVRSPIVPPMTESMSTNLAALSFVILSNFGVLKSIFTYRRLCFDPQTNSIKIIKIIDHKRIKSSKLLFNSVGKM